MLWLCSQQELSRDISQNVKLFHFLFGSVQPIEFHAFLYVFSGQQQSATSRKVNPSEKPLQPVEPANSNLKAKKLRLDESPFDGFITILPERFLMKLLMQDDSLKQYFFLNHLLSFLLFLSRLLQPDVLFRFLPLCSSFSGLSMWGGEGGSVSLRPEESWSEESPWWRRAEGSRC